MTDNPTTPIAGPAPAAPQTPAWWRDFCRREILAAIEEVTAQSLDANDPLPDTLIAGAQQLGLRPIDLRLWIYDDPRRRDWDMDALARWAQRFNLGVYSAAAADAAGES